MIRCPLALLAVLAPLAAAQAGNLDEEFRDPPRESAPLTWWHWMNGNVTESGITKDLEAMHEVGIGGVILFNIGRLPAGKVSFNSEDWWRHAAHAMREADRLGLRFGAFNSDGWSMSGGPWVPVEDSMKMLTWSETRVAGGQLVDIELAHPPFNVIYEDIAVQAIPALPGESALTARPVRSSGVADVPALLDGNLESTATFNLDPRGGRHPWVTLDLGDLRRLRRVEVEPVELNRKIPTWLEVEVSGDGKSFRKLENTLTVSLKYDSPIRSGTLAFPVAAARFVRLTLVSRPRDEAGKVVPARIGEVRFFEAPRVHYWEAKSGQSKQLEHYNQAEFRLEVEQSVAEKLPVEWAVSGRDILDLGAKLDDNGRLRWAAPPGDWLVLRTGYTSTLRRNQPASDAGRGYEADKMSVTATENHFDSYIGRMDAMFREITGRPLDFMQMESWEAGIQNWTAGFESLFEEKRGYSPIPWLPVLAGGRVVESYEASDRFLWDMRRTVAELIAEKYWATMLRLSRERGITVLGEGSGNQHFLYDPAMYHAKTDIPMGEFWTDVDYVRVDCRNAASVAHTLGLPLVAAESYTGRGERVWREGPADFKAQGDAAWLLGVNQFVLHSYVHQPWDVAPGFTLHRFGNHFHRLNPWFTRSKGWFDYMRRGQHLLRHGRHVADLAYFTGEAVPSYLGAPGELSPALPEGFDFDGVSLDVLKTMSVENGRLLLPSGARYEVLVFQDGVHRGMTLSLLREVARLVDAGATVVAERPGSSPSRSDDGREAEVDALVAQLWAGGARSIQDGPLERLLENRGTVPDFSHDGRRGVSLGHLHRSSKEAEIYLVVNRGLEPVAVTASFRDGKDEAEAWDPVTGQISRLPVTVSGNGRFGVPLTLAGHGSLFIVFRDSPLDSQPVSNTVVRTQPLQGPWRVRFSDGVEREWKNLSDWSASSDDAVRYFSGTARYETVFEVEARHLDAAHAVDLDLGDLYEVADVYLNGRFVQNLWTPPYVADLAEILVPGENRLVVEVTNTAVNALIGDERFPSDLTWLADRGTGRVLDQPVPAWVRGESERSSPRRTFVTYTWFDAESPLQPSGLLGEVRLIFRQKP